MRSILESSENIWELIREMIEDTVPGFNYIYYYWFKNKKAQEDLEEHNKKLYLE